MHTYPDVRLFIGGEWRDALAAETIAVVDPATEEVIGCVAHARHADLDLALEAADKGFTLWRQTSAFDRCKLMRRDRRHLALTREQGKPLHESRREVTGKRQRLSEPCGQPSATRSNTKQMSTKSIMPVRNISRDSVLEDQAEHLFVDLELLSSTQPPTAVSASPGRSRRQEGESGRRLKRAMMSILGRRRDQVPPRPC
ncbi:UNVERIFIED_ORG: hypothetical protein BTE55_00715 [Rhizobium sophorae]